MQWESVYVTDPRARHGFGSHCPRTPLITECLTYSLRDVRAECVPVGCFLVYFFVLLCYWQPIRDMVKDYGLMNISEHQKKAAFRQWSTTAHFIVEALEKIAMVAHDEGELSREAVELYWTSCTAISAPYCS